MVLLRQLHDAYVGAPKYIAKATAAFPQFTIKQIQSKGKSLGRVKPMVDALFESAVDPFSNLSSATPRQINQHVKRLIRKLG